MAKAGAAGEAEHLLASLQLEPKDLAVYRQAALADMEASDGNDKKKDEPEKK